MKYPAKTISARNFILMILSLLVISETYGAEANCRPGIELLYRLDCLAQFKESIKVASVSSYDTTGGNNDGFDGLYSYVRKEKDGLVIADLKGPGIIYRIWTPTPTDDIMEFYFDGEGEPRISVPFRDIFIGQHPAFEPPLVGYGAGGFYSYVPLAYEKSCKILIQAEKIQFYQINYAVYPENSGITSWIANPNENYKSHIEKVKKLFASYGSDISTYVIPEGGKVEKVITKVNLAADKTVILFNRDQPGRIVGMRLGPAKALVGKKRDIILRAYWDGDKEPAILSPAGDFFGYAWGEPAMKSLLVGTSNDINYCYFPMPISQSGRIELYAEPTLEREVTLEAEVLFVPIAQRENEGKFYALWRRENPTTIGRPFTFIETEGRGHLVGVVHQAQGLEPGSTRFFEGDDQTTIDGEPVIHGTGSEDFYNGGWYYVPGRWETRKSFVLSGCLAYKHHLSRSGGYRMFLGDAYAYRKSLLQTIEHAPANNDMPTDYCAVTYLYSRERPTCTFELPAVEERKVLDPESIVFFVGWHVPVYSFSFENMTLKKISLDKMRVFSIRATENDIFGLHSVSFICEIPSADRYKIYLDVVKGPEQGIVQLFQNEAAIGPKVDLYHDEYQKSEGEYMATMILDEGPNNLMFKLVGTNEKSTGLGFDLINIRCTRVE